MTDLTPKTERQFIAASHALAGTFADHFARLGIAPDTVANLIGAALAEVMAQQIGPFNAVERLRDLADTLESQLLTEGSVN